MSADTRDTEKVLAGAAELLDFGKPIAIVALLVLQYAPDHDDPWARSVAIGARPLLLDR